MGCDAAGPERWKALDWLELELYVYGMVGGQYALTGCPVPGDIYPVELA